MLTNGMEMRASFSCSARVIHHMVFTAHLQLTDIWWKKQQLKQLEILNDIK